MRRMFLFGLAACIGAASPTLAGPEIPATAIKKGPRLLGAKKICYLLRQLDLTEEQATGAQGLLDSIFPDRTRPSPPDTDEVRRIWTEIEKAKQAEDQARLDALTKQLQQMNPNFARDAEFFINLEPLLTDQQKEKLDRARARLERNSSGALRPVDLLRAARDLDLTAQQQRALLDAFAATRKQLGPILRPSADLKLRMINSLADLIRALLMPDQVAGFEQRVYALRPDLVDRGLRVQGPAEFVPDEPAADEQIKPTDD